VRWEQRAKTHAARRVWSTWTATARHDPKVRVDVVEDLTRGGYWFTFTRYVTGETFSSLWRGLVYLTRMEAQSHAMDTLPEWLAELTLANAP
jgi:hypothetical protein